MDRMRISICWEKNPLHITLYFKLLLLALMFTKILDVIKTNATENYHLPVYYIIRDKDFIKFDIYLAIRCPVYKINPN